jgi:hypothetical protein
MAITKYTNPPQTPSGSGTFSDNLVGFQLVQGGGLTQGNFEFTESITEKVNRNFLIGAFSDPITLDTLQIDNLSESRSIIAKNFKVYPNFDLTNVTNFTLYGSLTKRFSVSVEKIINNFPAAIEISSVRMNFTTGSTATNIIYDSVENETSFDIDVSVIRNPFEIDFSVNSAVNIAAREIPVHKLRNFSVEYKKYSLFINSSEHEVIFATQTTSLTSGVLTLYVKGNPFSGQSISYDYLIIRPNSYYTEETFTQDFDEVEKFLLNRLINPPYTASFQTPEMSDNGTYYLAFKQATWPLDGTWNLDIRTLSFDGYLILLSQIAENIDEYKTNLISRFLTTASLKEFDTPDQKVEKIFQIYGRSFDEVKHFIDSLAFMNSVNYNIHNDIPSQLLKNLAETIGWKTNISPITNEDFLTSVFGNTTVPTFSGYSRAMTPDELNYQYYRNIIMNSAYLFKSKGTRKSIEGLLRLIGAPEALVEFNETIYLADQKINMNQFEERYASISGGTYVDLVPSLDPSNIYKILGVQYTGFTLTPTYESVNTTRVDYPIDNEGYPAMPEASDNFFFQKGAGWFESTPQHRSPEIVNLTKSVFTGQNFNIQTSLEPFTYGQKYLQRYRTFPYIDNGFKIYPVSDNKKSWVLGTENYRKSSDGNFNAKYNTLDDRLVINVKNVDLYMNVAQGLAYDVWVMCNKYDYPIPESGFTAPYPSPFGIDWTVIDPQPKKKTFFEFAQTFWQNMINVRDRQFNTDGKTSGYPLLQKIYWMYLQSGQAINVPNDNFTYRTMIDYVVGLGDYWVRLVEQMIPATTIWNGGQKYENSIFHRQKFVWRRQAGCRIIPIPCEPCSIKSNLFPIECQYEELSCPLYPKNPTTGLDVNFYDILNGVLVNDNVFSCNLTTLTTQWYVNVIINGNQVISYNFYNGSGYNAPTSTIWNAGVLDALENLYNYGLWFYIVGETITIFNLTCTANNTNFEINIGINYSITC